METILTEARLLYFVALIIGLIWYLPRLRCWFSATAKQPRLRNPVQNRLCIIIPARNESKSIPTLLDSITRQNYPKDRFDTQIIVADPDDPTVKIAERYGMRAHVIADQKCKGDALDGCLQTLLREDDRRYDAYIIVDADCVLDVNFLCEMNNAMASGRDIIVSKKIVKNYFFGDKSSQTLSACCNGVIWTLMDNMGNKYKSAHGYPCFVVGTGLLLTGRVVRQNNGWPYRDTLTEDVELMHDSVLKGYKTFYYEHAILYMEEAERLSVTNKRRKRWMTGVTDSERLYGKRVRAKGSIADRYYTSSLHPVYFIMGTSTAYFFLMLAFAGIFLLTGNPLRLFAIRCAIEAFLVVYGSFFCMTAVALYSDRKYIKLPLYRKIILLFAHPIFYMDYILIVGKAIFFPGERKWEVIDRVDFAEVPADNGEVPVASEEEEK